MQNSILGKGVKVAVFDTGVPKSHPHFKNIKDRTDWTDDKVASDGTLIFTCLFSALFMNLVLES